MAHNLPLEVRLRVLCDRLSVELFARGEPLLANKKDVDETLLVYCKDEDGLNHEHRS